MTILPPLTLIGAARQGARALAVNLLALGLVVAAVTALVALGEPVQQWAAVGLGVYAVFSWAAALRRRDPPAFRLIVANPAFVCTVVAYGLNAFISYSVSFWASPHALRDLGGDPASAGFIIGSAGALAGFLGVTLGGAVADRLRQRFASGRVMVVIFGAVAPVPAILIAFTTPDLWLFYAVLPVAQLLASSALGAAAATTQDLVLPRMRGTATATFFIGTTLLGLAMGPYLAGRVSTLTGSLSTGVIALLLTVPVTLAAGIAAYRLVPLAEANRLAWAAEKGEMPS